MKPMQMAHKLYNDYYPLSKEDALGIATSFLFWSTLYVIINMLPLPLAHKGKVLSRSNELDVKNRLVSLIHGLVLVIFSAPEFYLFPGSCGDANTLYEKRLIYTAVGYFLYDFLAMAYYGLLDAAMSFHHWTCIIGMSLPLTYGMSGNYVV